MSVFLMLVWLAAVDGGTPAPKPQLSADDKELLEHLDMLESFDEVKDLELLEELSVER